MSFPCKCLYREGYHGWAGWAQAGFRVCWHQRRVYSGHPSRSGTLLAYPRCQPGIAPHVNLHPEAQNEGWERIAGAGFHREKGFCLKTWWYLFHLNISFHFSLFSVAQEKTSKAFVVRERLPLFSAAFWGDGLPEGNVSMFAPRIFIGCGGLQGQFSWKSCRSCCVLWFDYRSSELGNKRQFFASFVVNQHTLRL